MIYSNARVANLSFIGNSTDEHWGSTIHTYPLPASSQVTVGPQEILEQACIYNYVCL